MLFLKRNDIKFASLQLCVKCLFKISRDLCFYQKIPRKIAFKFKRKLKAQHLVQENIKCTCMEIFPRTFGGRADDELFLAEADNLGKALGDVQDYHQDFYYTAGYDSPYKLFNRRNEVWFIKK